MVERVQYTIDSLAHTTPFFGDGSNLEYVFGLLHESEKPIMVYNDAGFNDILLIDRKKNHYRFLMNTMPVADRNILEEKANDFMDKFSEDGSWLWDMKNNKPVYNYQSYARYGKWGFFALEEFGHYLALSGDGKVPLKLYNNQNKNSIYWAVYFLNKHFSNPSGTLADEFGSLVVLEFAQKFYNLNTFTVAHYEKEKVMKGVQVWEKTYPEIPTKLLKKFHKEHSKLYRDEGKEKKVTVEGDSAGLNLSDSGMLYLSDLTDSEIPQDFYAVEVDLVLDPRIIGAFVSDGKIFFGSAVVLDEKAKGELLKIMGINAKNTEIKSNAQLDNLLSMSDQIEWFRQIHGEGSLV
jgi:hypothetical protein